MDLSHLLQPNMDLLYTHRGKAFELIELSEINDRGFYADGGHEHTPKQCFHGGSTNTKLL